jgi:threonylcarbamoyladenosine tRNA methylthiotransferase MtaB
MATVAIATLGCKVNQYESEALTASLEEKGYRLIPLEEGADIAIINTCTVTHRADFQSRQMIRRALRFNPKSTIIVTGCYSQVDPGTIEKIEGVHYLVGNSEKNRIADLLPLMEKGRLQRMQVSDIQDENLFSDIPLFTFHHHTRAFFKIQDGCNASCSYCIVPHARGRSRSLPVDKLLDHMRTLEKRGYREVVLTGIHIGSYGLDLNPRLSLNELFEQLEKKETPARIRLSSIEPGDFSPELISTISRSDKICPHLHIPIQSGDDDILRKMNRNYNHSFLVDLFEELDQKIPNLSIGADVIVGFPGETEEQFDQTYRLVESLPFSYLHVFPFSKRKGTPAFGLPQSVTGETVRKRAEKLRTLSKEKRQAFYRRFIDQELKVLVEDRMEKGTGKWRGLSRNYIPVLLTHETKSQNDPDWNNTEWRVRVTESTERGVSGLAVERMDG